MHLVIDNSTFKVRVKTKIIFSFNAIFIDFNKTEKRYDKLLHYNLEQITITGTRCSETKEKIFRNNS